jgi:hypothetical protein
MFSCVLGSVHAQVIIKEHVSINPVQKMVSHILSDSSSGHTILLKMSWTNPSFMGEMYIQPPTACLGGTAISNFDLSSPINYAITATRAGYYGFTHGYHNPTFPGDFNTFISEIDLDGVRVAFDSTYSWYPQTQIPGWVFSGINIGYTYSNGYYSAIRIPSGPSSIFHNGYRGMGATPAIDCSSPAIWYPLTQPVTVSIPVGSQYGSFHRIYDNSVYSSFSDLAANISNYQYVADGALPTGAGSMVVIQLTSQGITKRDSFYVTPNNLKVTFVPDTIGYADSYTGTPDSSKIFVTAVDSNGNPITIPDSTLLNLTIEQQGDTMWGFFYDAQGSPHFSPFTNASYGDLRTGRIIFCSGTAHDTLTMRPVWITATGSHLTGQGVVYLGRKTLRIVTHQPWTIWPYMPRQNNGDNRGSDLTGYNPKRSFTLQLKGKNRRPLAGQAVTIKTTCQVGSAGHGHVHGDSLLPQAQQGLFYSSIYHNNPLTSLVTDANGVATIDSFRASQYSGIYTITAFLPSDTTISDTVKVNVMIQNLIDFGGSDYCVLTGNDTYAGMNHPSNHWCTQRMKDSLLSVVRTFYEWTCTSAGGGSGIPLSVDDMSLTWGGEFDIHGSWIPDTAHSFHRVGYSVDILRSGLGGIWLTPSQVQHLEGFFTDALAKRNHHEKQIHFGFFKEQ